MSDIFISYARQDRARVEPLVRLLESRGWKVWWDRDILPGTRFEQIIDEAIVKARCVIVVWTENSVASDWVNAEAGDGLERGILVPVMFDSVRLPLAYRRWQAARLIDWPDISNETEQQLLLDAIDGVLHGRRPAEMVPGQKRPNPVLGRARRIGLAALALAVLVVAGWWLLVVESPPRSETLSFRQLTLVETAGDDPTYLAGSLVQEVSASLNRHTDLQVLSASDGEFLDGFVLRSVASNGFIDFRLYGPDGELLVDRRFPLDSDSLITSSNELSQAVVERLGLRFIPPASQPLSGTELELYLQSINALRASESARGINAAEQNILILLERHPRHVSVLVASCRLNLRLFVERRSVANFEAAEKHCHRAITLDNRNVGAELALGELYSMSGMHDEAITRLLSLARRAPYNVEAIRTLGHAYLEAGAEELAQIQFNKAVQLEPGYWLNHKAVGGFLLRQGRYTEAVEAYWRAANLATNKAGPLGDVAAALYLSGEFEDAVDVWQQTLELEPLPPTYANLGSAYFFLGEFQLAAQMYDKAIAIAPDDYRYWGLAGEVRLQFLATQAPDFFHRAIELASPARAINPKDAQLLGDLAGYQAALGERDTAIELIAQARSLEPGDIDVLYLEALVWARLDESGELEKVIAQLVKAGYSEELIRRDANFGGSSHDSDKNKNKNKNGNGNGNESKNSNKETIRGDGSVGLAADRPGDAAGLRGQDRDYRLSG